MPEHQHQQSAVAMAQTIKRARAALVEAVAVRLRGDQQGGLRAVHTQVFDHLDPDGTRLTVLAERAQMSHQSMGELVGELVELGYLERVRDPADGRARLLRATPAGLRHIGGAVEHLVGIRERWQRELGGLAVDEVLHALRILTTICESAARPQHS